MKAELITTQGEYKTIKPKNNKNFTLNELQGFVGGYIEIVPSKYDGKVLIINEEGKNLNLPYNQLATRDYKYNETDVIMGNAVLADNKMIN